MVDRVYKASLPRYRKSLEKLKDDFSRLDGKTDWVGLRIEPLLKHLDSLERIMNSAEYSEEFLHLRKGLELFHSDLVYLSTNVRGLEKVLKSERNRSRKSE